MSQSTFKRKAHKGFFTRCLQALPSSAEAHDANRITIAFFCLGGLYLLGELSPSDKDRQDWTEWIWSLQSPEGGFAGSPHAPKVQGHLPSTYTALCCLALLGSPMDRLDKPALRRFLKSCQAEDGSFAPTPDTEGMFQNDARMSYCAVVCGTVADSGTEGEGRTGGFNKQKAAEYLRRCQTWEGGFASRPGVVEAQGGMTYCALSSLALLGELKGNTELEEEATRWLSQRQIGGFQGRPGKLEDVCYSFWCGGALAALGHSDLVNEEPNTAFLLNSQSPLGGFGKAPEDYPDPFHSYLALTALAMTPAREQLGLAEIDPVWNLAPEMRDRLLKPVP
ncbi:hypothetical protein A1Q2_03035 [Trichosporon asahii var. asahii CBS 8904]|uniref:Prenyltransferase alpha-alpha toroid domain-containing protein n=1 Tax=Trichosporon asahii var. asahii (strain CBS 8904) TaxID=1220162 RepID=K1WND4_TRIAC|nr:hypothetical protein A1Q2_03035 [Trichosporon asahii var. asahii CBS 8904]